MISHSTANATAHGMIRGAARALSYAASPTFALMALAAQVHAAPDMMGMPMPSPLVGMPAMYLLMSVFHASPWLKLFARQAAQSTMQGHPAR